MYQSRLKQGGMMPFTIEVSWLQSVRSSLPPPDNLVEDTVVDDQIFDAMV